MGNNEHHVSNSIVSSSVQQSSIHQYKITYHTHQNTPDLLRIFKLFLREPFHFIHSIDIQTQQHNCCDRLILKVKSPYFPYNLQSLLNLKRKNKGFFVEKQIWYVVRTIVGILAYMQAQRTVLGILNPIIFNLDRGRFLTAEILHLMPQNQHEKNFSLHNYYSPEKLRQISNQPFAQYKQTINLFKSEVFSFGLLLLEIATCPAPKPKFHKSNLRQMIWPQVASRFQIVQQRYSDKLLELLDMILRQDARIRPDWGYLKMWVKKNQGCIDIAPCIFWSV